MKEAGATTGDDVSKVMKPILKVGESPKDGAGAGAGAGEKKVIFADTSPALSTEENKTINDFSKAFDLNEKRMEKIFQDSKTSKGIQEIDKAYLVDKGEKNERFKESSFFKGLLPENDKKVENGPASLAVNGNNLEEDQLKKKGGLTSEGQEKGGGEEKKGDNKKLMLAMGFLFIACIFLATGGAALPIIGGFLASSQGLLIAGAVGAGLVGAGSFIKDQISQGNNNPGGMKMVEGVGAQGQGQTQENAPAPAPEKAQGQGQTPEKAQGQAPAQEKAQGQAPAQEKSQGQGQTPEKAQAQAPEKAPAPDLMELMRRDLEKQNFKEEMTKFSNDLIGKSKFKAIVDQVSSNEVSNKPHEKSKVLDEAGVDKVKPDEITKKLAKNVSKDNGKDSESQSQLIKALNLETPKTNRLDPSSKSWVERTNKVEGSRGISGARDV